MAKPPRSPDRVRLRAFDLDPSLDPRNQVEEDEHEREPGYVSRGRLRDQAREYLDLAEALTKGKYTHLPNPPFDETLRKAVADAQRFEKNARSRQIRRVAQLLRELDGAFSDLQDALEGRTPAQRAQQALERRCEDWRTRLIGDGDPALAEFCDAHPGGDRQRIRQLARQARRTPPDARSKRAATALIREIRPLIFAAAAEVDQTGPAEPTEPTEPDNDTNTDTDSATEPEADDPAPT